MAPIDLRVDHVYLMSCKYLSKILFNVSPASIFDSLLFGGQGRGTRASREVLPGGGDWYAEVAPAEYQALYESVAPRGLGRPPWGTAVLSPASPTRWPAAGHAPAAVALPGLGGEEAAGAPEVGRAPGLAAPSALGDLPRRAVDLTVAQREALGHWLRPGWPPGAKELYTALSRAVAGASARRWEAAMDDRGGTGEAMLWRLLRMGSAPYFVLGSSAERSLRLRIATSWDWRQQFQLIAIAMEGQRGANPGWAGRPWSATAPPTWSTRWRATSRCAGATGASVARPRPRATSIRHTTLFRGTSPCDEHVRPRRVHAPAAGPGLAVPPLVLRPFAIADLAMVRQAAADPLIPSISSVPRRYTDDAGRAFIERQLPAAPKATATRSSSRPRTSPKRASGPSDCGCRRSRAGAPPSATGSLAGARGNGLAAHALRAVVAFAFDALAIPRLHLFVEPWNVASARTAEAAGFHREATLRGWERIDGEQRDADCFALLHAEWTPAPSC